MAIAKTQLKSIITGTEEIRIESLRQLLNYPFSQKDPQGSRFWYLCPANDEDDAEDTCPIAVSFYSELNELTSDNEVKQFFSSDEQDTIIRGHYTGSTAENQPVMYLLFPLTTQGRVAFILPSESRLRQRSIQSFSYDDADLLARLGRLQWAELADKVLKKAINLIPQVHWIFYKPAVTAKELAEELAIVTQRIEEVIPSVYHSEGIGEKLRLYAICQAYCYNSYYFLKSLPSLGFDYFYLMATAGDRLPGWGDRLPG